VPIRPDELVALIGRADASPLRSAPKQTEAIGVT